MKTTLALASLVTLIASPAIAGQSSTPFMSIHDLDLDGNKLEKPSCSDGWVQSVNQPDKCIPFNNSDLPEQNAEHNTILTNSAVSSSESSSVANANSINNSTIRNTVELNERFNVAPISAGHNALTVTAGTDFDSVAVQANYTYQFGRPKVNKVTSELEFLQACKLASEFEVAETSEFAKCPKMKQVPVVEVPSIPENAPMYDVMVQQAELNRLKDQNQLLEMRLNQLLNNIKPIPAKG
jgi:hypothetical protein